MAAILCSLQGRFGNCVMQYLFCRALAERTRSDLCLADPWEGERIFDIPVVRLPHVRATRRMNAVEALQWALLPESERYDIEVRDYCQHQACMIYTKRQAQSWLKMRPEIETACANAVLADGGKDDRIVLHRRVGDYVGYGYPVVSMKSYKRACEQFGLLWESPNLSILTEEDPTPHAGFLADELGFLPDFYRMMVAPTLLRGNSSFSWLAALLGDGLVLAPLVEGLAGGKEHDCGFVAGNWPRFTNLDFVTDLYVAP